MIHPSRSRLATCVVLGSLCARAAPAGTFPYPVARRTLDNGLDVYVVPIPSPGVVAFATWMSVGSRDEVEAGRTGFAHFFEHLMFHGTPTFSRDGRERELLRLGIEDNAWTWLDETVYHGLLPADALPRYVEIEADRFRHLELDEAGVRREAGAVYGEFRKGQADPDQVLTERLQAAAFGVHTYGHDTIGLEADIAAMPEQLDAARTFFDRYYRPDLAVVLVVGDVEPEATFALVAGRFGAWERGVAERPAVPPEPPQDAERRVHVDWSGPATPRLAMTWKIPAHRAEDSAPAARLELAAHLLLSPTGDLERRLVREEGLAHAVWGGRDTTVDPGLLRVEVAARDASALPRIEAIVREEVAALAAGVDAAELERLRTHQRYALLSSLDDPMSVLHVVGFAVRRDRDPASIDRFQDALAAATADDVAATVREVLVDRNLTVGTLSTAEAP